MAALYDKIGINYDELRRPDRRIAAVIHDALGDARTVLNVGAGTGSYEPPDRAVTAVEPSAEMIAKRPAHLGPAVQAHAEALPFPDASFDASMAILTVHHWTDVSAGLRELRRVTRGPIVILTFDASARPWPTDYFPELATLDEAKMPPMETYASILGPVDVTPVMVPGDCTDGFLYAYWKRPHAYLDERLRSGSSSFWSMADVQRGVDALSTDLASGDWRHKYGTLTKADEYDAGYRLVVRRAPRSGATVRPR